MPLSAGARLGSFEILAPLGAGGMGEVYRAKDTRLGREVAVKVLPDEVATDRERLARFEQEARAASALNHPNILTVYEIGSEGGHPFIAMELVDGKSLRELIEAGPLPLRKGLDLAAQIAEGLAKAHSAGIVHRDLKPENVMVSKDGFAKILDFGLAKLAQPLQDSSSTTIAAATRPGVIMGTIGYMSPEQATGRLVDYRSDQFSFGAIGYEMATGKPPFARASSAETLTAIIRDDPEPIAERNAKVPAPVRWIIDRCLAKDPEDRYASTKDLARDLKSVKDHLSEASVSGAVPVAPARRARRGRLAAAGVALALLAGLLGAFVARLTTPAAAPAPQFQRLTFERGSITGARFTADGQTVVFSAAWNGAPIRLFATRPGSSGESPIALPDASIFSISSTGELAIGVKRQAVTSLYSMYTLAQVPLTGGAPREILENVVSADWSPTGRGLAVVHTDGDQTRLEFPVGKTLDQTGGWLSHLRFSPDGTKLAFLDHPNASDGGTVSVVDTATGNKTILSRDWESLEGLAWRPDDGEVWFTGTRAGAATHIYGVTLDGKERLILRAPGEVTLWDVQKDGRVLFTTDDWRAGVIASAPDAKAERDISVMDYTLARDISPDGRYVAVDDSGEGGGAEGAVFLAPTDGSPPIRLGAGTAGGLSPDGRWVVSTDLQETKIVLLPTGPGQPVTIPCGTIVCSFPTFSADGRNIVYQGVEPGRGARIFVRAADGSGTARSIDSPGLNPSTHLAVSPDGRFVAAFGANNKPMLYSLTGGAPVEPPGAQAGDHPSQWGPDGKTLYVSDAVGTGLDVYQLDVTTGRRTLWKHLAVDDAAGIVSVPSVILTRDGRAFAETYVRILSTLFEASPVR